MDTVAEIKQKLDIASVIGEYLELKKAGMNFRARCPFHHEKTPSFFVSPDRQSFHCFGCGEGGDMFSFIQKIEGVEFPEALRLLAQKAGVTIERFDPRIASQKNRLVDVCEEAARFWQANLKKDIGKKALYIYSFLALSSALLLSMSRGAWFSITIAMIFMFIMICRKKKGFFISLLFLAFLTVAVIFIFNAIDLSALSRRISSYKELDFSGRIEIWKGTLQIIKHNWLLGTGIGTFIYNFPAYRAPGLNMFVNFSHNDYLQIASEAGIFSLMPAVFMIFMIIRKGIITHNIASTSFRKWIPLALVTGILSLAIHGLGDFNFYIPANALLFVH